MSVRPKTLRRLGIIFGVGLVLIGVAAALYLRNEHVKNKKLQALRSAGIASFEKGDYGAALENLKHYVGKVPTDADALYAYGASRFRYEESDDHIREAKNALLMVLQYDPNHLKTKRTLLELYTRAQF